MIGSVDPTNLIYFLSLYGILLWADPRQFSDDEYVARTLFHRYKEGIPESQYQKLLIGKRCDGVLNDGGDILESIIGITDRTDPRSKRMRQRIIDTHQSIEMKDFEAVGSLLALVVRRCRDVASFTFKQCNGSKQLYYQSLIKLFGVPVSSAAIETPNVEVVEVEETMVVHQEAEQNVTNRTMCRVESVDPAPTNATPNIEVVKVEETMVVYQERKQNVTNCNMCRVESIDPAQLGAVKVSTVEKVEAVKVGASTSRLDEGQLEKQDVTNRTMCGEESSQSPRQKNPAADDI